MWSSVGTVKKRGKRYTELCNKVDKKSAYAIGEAVELISRSRSAKFDESVDIAVKVGIDPKHADQQIRNSLVLPHGTGKTPKVLVFADEKKSSEAREAGADYAGLEEFLKKVEKENWLDFDVTIATPDVMAEVGKLSRILGPRGLMPSPKMGTVTADVAGMVKKSKSGRIEIKSDKGGVVHASVGKSSFEISKIRENLLFFLLSLLKLKPRSSKGEFFKKVTVSNTMGPAIGLDLMSIKEEVKAFEVGA